MKSYLIICCLYLPAFILQTQGYISEDATNWQKADPGSDNLAPLLSQQEDANVSCNCATECSKLHVTRLPTVVRDKDNYLSYENFPVLCRDASSILLPPNPRPPQSKKKYVCKETFDCCRKCNHVFYQCMTMPSYTYGACLRGAYKCMCDCIDRKSFKELPYRPPPVPTTPPP